MKFERVQRRISYTDDLEQMKAVWPYNYLATICTNDKELVMIQIPLFYSLLNRMDPDWLTVITAHWRDGLKMTDAGKKIGGGYKEAYIITQKAKNYFRNKDNWKILINDSASAELQRLREEVHRQTKRAEFMKQEIEYMNGDKPADTEEGEPWFEEISESAMSTSLEQVYDVYPYNLCRAVFCEKYGDFCITAVDDVLLTLTAREKTVLECRFRDKMTLEETGAIFGVTRDRIRQIEAKALRRLRHPMRSRRLLAVSKDEAWVNERKRQSEAELQRDEALVDLQKAKNEIRRLTIKLTNAGVQVEPLHFNSIGPVNDISIEELELSVRSYNCLNRAGKKTIGDLTKMTMSDMMRVRNLGRKSMDEIIERLAAFGLSLMPDDID